MAHQIAFELTCGRFLVFSFIFILVQSLGIHQLTQQQQYVVGVVHSVLLNINVCTRLLSVCDSDDVDGSFVRSFVRYKSEQKGIKEQRQHYLDVAREHDATMALWYPTKNALVRFAGCEKNGGLATTPPPLLSETSEEFCKIPGISQRL